MSVGVGTGGKVSDGSSARGAVLAAGGGTLGSPAVSVEGGAPGAAEPVSVLSAGDDQSTTFRGVGAVARVGAAPMPPAPTGALIGAGPGVGPANCQPTVTAKGSPRATRPRKIDLGESRTHEHRFAAPKGYGVFRNSEIRSRSSRRLLQSTAGRS